MTSRLRRRPRPQVDAVLVLAFAIDTAIAVIDAFTAAVLINLVVVGPLLAATRAGPRRTAVISVYAVALAIYDGAQLSSDASDPAAEETARHGRQLIDRLADRWGLRDGGRCVWFEIDRHA